MAVNKVIYGNNTLIDLTSDTVDASKILSGYTAHDKSGAKITGNISSQGANTITPTSAGTQTVCSSGKYTTGDQKVNIDANSLGVIASKIIQGQSILGVGGSVDPGSAIDILYLNTWRTSSSKKSQTYNTSKKINLVVTSYDRYNNSANYFGFAYFDLVNKKCGRYHYGSSGYVSYLEGTVTQSGSYYSAYDSNGLHLYDVSTDLKTIITYFKVNPSTYITDNMEIAFGG